MFFARLLLLSTVLGAVPGAAQGAPPARLVYAAGRVTVEPKGGAAAPAKAGAPLGDGDAVATGAGATAVVELADRTRLKLRESSRLVLNLPSARSTATEIFLSLGGVFAKVTKRRPGEEFRVTTPTVAAAVRGTRFFTAYGRAGAGGRDLWVCVDEGVVEVRTSASKGALSVPAGKGVLIKSGRALTKPQAYDWTKKLNWNMDAGAGSVEDKTNLDAAYSDLLDQDYR
ncbi:MAG TPA: FecR family protein [Elusimicrobiota bacterium]|nr:FecR family protein [Elusimicrobiota bacterium]